MGTGGLQIVFLFYILHSSLAYNFLPVKSRQISHEGYKPDDLFGWSVFAWRSQIIVGAPGQDGVGAVHACNGSTLQCRLVDQYRDTALAKSGFFGSVLSGDENYLYACAPLAYLDAYQTTQTTGICYKEISGTFREFAEFNIRKNGKSRLGNKLTGATQAWYWSGMFGVSATVINDVLYVGSPFQSSKLKTFTGNVVGLDHSRSIMLTDPNYANFVNGVNSTLAKGLLLAGETVEKGSFYSNNDQMIVSSVKADSLRGKVFVCGECFKDSKARSLLNKNQNLEVSGKTIGERFGKATAACDLTGDGLDDLIVGAPYGSKTEHEFDSGKVFVYVMNETKNVLEKASPWSITYKEKVNGARFGEALACLGDTDNDSHEDIVIGAPYYLDNGAIFIYYGSKVGISDKKPQIILGKDLVHQPKGFGKSLAKVNWKTLAVGAHVSNQVILIESRPVVRFLPQSSAQSLTSTIELTQKQNFIEMQVELRLEFPSLPLDEYEGLSATIHFILDERLEKIDPKKVIIKKVSDQWNLHTFRFKSLKNSFDEEMENLHFFPKPVEIQTFVDWTIVKSKECEFDPQSHCPMLDPNDQNIHKEKLEKIKVPFKGSCSAGGCECELQVHPHNLSVTGTESFETDLITIINVGSQIADPIEIMIQPNDDVEVSIKECNEKARNIFSCPILLAKKSFQFRINFEVETDESKTINLKIDVNNTCRFQSLPTSISMEINIENIFEIVPVSLSSRSTNVALVRKKEKANVRHFYKLKNIGPSNAKNARVLIGIIRKNLEIFFSDVSIEEEVCSSVELISDDPSEQMTELTEGGKLAGMCSVEDNCLIIKCITRLDKQTEKEIEITINVDEDSIAENSVLQSVLSSFSSNSKISTVYQTSVLRLRNYNLALKVLPDQSDSFLIIGHSDKIKTGVHTYQLDNNGPDNSGDVDVHIDVLSNNLEIAKKDVLIEGADCMEGEASHSQEFGSMMSFICGVNVVKESTQIITVSVTMAKLNEIEVEDFVKLKLNSSVSVWSSDESSKSVSFETQFDERLESTIISNIVNSWHIFLGVAVGIIIIIVVVLILLRLDIFNKVRVYRDDIDQIHSRNNSIMRNSVENRDIFIEHERKSMAEQNTNTQSEALDIELQGIDNKVFENILEVEKEHPNEKMPTVPPSEDTDAPTSFL